MTTVPANVQFNKAKSKWTIGQIILVAIIFVFVLTCVLPFLNVIAISLSSKSAILRGDVSFWPVEFETKAYEILFASLPNELEEAATIDGANDFQILFKVYLPLSLASIATLTLFYAVGKWNSFADAKYYIQTKALQPLQLRLYNIIKGSTAVDVTAIEGNANSNAQNVSESIESATIIFATLPILVVYPFVQRYFVSGVTIGAVKG